MAIDLSIFAASPFPDESDGYDKTSTGVEHDRRARGWAHLAALLSGAAGGFCTWTGNEQWHTAFVDSGKDSRLNHHVGRVVGDAAARHVLARRDALIVEDTSHFWCRPATPVALAEIRAVIAVPVFAAGDFTPNVVVGAVEPKTRRWHGRDIDNLWTIAEAVRNAPPLPSSP